ncbi:glutathione S-transferase Ure2-like protein [Amylocarpus encephaloides]|uniref:Glutathione S-transferase Ure2-like protein n=1 Tax=Amylocarpus encephaloides TaxID=45428 RepID=A0A9P7Y864_9HELO|nr:glutathione S-transferase Ure2-like protein [Amylocarpus encephaloides]
MSSQLKPIKLWGAGGANPPKVAIILEELDLPFEVIPVAIADVKKPEYVAVNPNGRLPSLVDPNFDITIWESGAIIEYLIERYDKENKISFAPGTKESYHAKQWLFYQVSGQGPYFGQAAWFKKFHPEPIPGALARYVAETNRVSAVLEKYLGEQKDQYGSAAGFDGPWLVGNKFSYADASFLLWHVVIQMVVSTEEFDEDEYPILKDWAARMAAQADYGQNTY